MNKQEIIWHIFISLRVDAYTAIKIYEENYEYYNNIIKPLEYYNRFHKNHK
jgi:hypothetical protein